MPYSGEASAEEFVLPHVSRRRVKTDPKKRGKKREKKRRRTHLPCTLLRLAVSCVEATVMLQEQGQGDAPHKVNAADFKLRQGAGTPTPSSRFFCRNAGAVAILSSGLVFTLHTLIIYLLFEIIT